MTTSKVVDLNQRALSLLQQGNFQESATVLASALNAIKSDCSHGTSLDSTKTKLECQQGAAFGSVEAGCIIQWSPQTYNHSIPTDSRRGNIYARPLLIKEVGTKTTTSTSTPTSDKKKNNNKDTLANAILYNLALSFHLRILQLGARGEPQLSRVLQLYQSVLHALPPRRTPSSLALETVVLFNTGIIHQQLLNFHQTINLFMAVSTNLCSVPDTTSFALHEIDMESMMLIVATFQVPCLASAA